MRPKLNPSSPIVFLDYDGVLHPAEVYRRRGRIVLMREGINLFEWSPMLVDALAPHPNTQLVLSTSWVRVLGFKRALEWLPATLRRRIVGATWHSRMSQAWWERSSRFEQIHAYVRRHECQRWLAIEDDHEHWNAEHHANLVALDGDLGLAQPEKLEELRRKLSWLMEP